MEAGSCRCSMGHPIDVHGGGRDVSSAGTAAPSVSCRVEANALTRNETLMSSTKAGERWPIKSNGKARS